MAITNEERIIRKLKGTEFRLGGVNEKIEQLSPFNLKKVTDGMCYGSCDVDVHINRKPFVVEISHVGNEIDFGVLSKSEYINRYGNERYEKNN